MCFAARKSCALLLLRCGLSPFAQFISWCVLISRRSHPRSKFYGPRLIAIAIPQVYTSYWMREEEKKTVCCWSSAPVFPHRTRGYRFSPPPSTYLFCVGSSATRRGAAPVTSSSFNGENMIGFANCCYSTRSHGMASYISGFFEIQETRRSATSGSHLDRCVGRGEV